jgi:hypothetical protein
MNKQASKMLDDGINDAWWGWCKAGRTPQPQQPAGKIMANGCVAGCVQQGLLLPSWLLVSSHPKWFLSCLACLLLLSGGVLLPCLLCLLPAGLLVFLLLLAGGVGGAVLHSTEV